MFLSSRRSSVPVVVVVVVALGSGGVARSAGGLSAEAERAYRQRVLVPNPAFSFGAPFFRDGVPVRPGLVGGNAAAFCGEFERCRAELRSYRRWRIAELTMSAVGLGLLGGGLAAIGLREDAANEGRREEGLRWTAVGLLTGTTLALGFSLLVAPHVGRARLLDAMRWHNVDLHRSLRGGR